MADISYTAPQRGLGIITRIGSAIAQAFVKFNQASDRYRQIEQLNALSDAQLAARGTTRHETIQKIFENRYGM